MVSISVVIAMLLAFAAGCARHEQSVKAQVRNSLDQAGMKDVNVDEDRGRRLVTLTGNVKDVGVRQQAMELAQNNAPGWAVANEIAVLPQGDEGPAKKIAGNIDDAIEKTYKATLIANRLDDEGIRFHSKNGVLELNGTVDNPNIRQQAQTLAATVPNVAQVVNKLDVKHQTATTTGKP
jgi:osmotically-inducible protein OsmY